MKRCAKKTKTLVSALLLALVLALGFAMAAPGGARGLRGAGAAHFDMWREGPCAEKDVPYEQPFVAAWPAA